MKVRISEGQIRYRLDVGEVHRLGAGERVTVDVDGMVTYTLHVQEVPNPLWTMSDSQFDLAIPRSEIQSPSTHNPTIYRSSTYLVELDLKPHHP